MPTYTSETALQALVNSFQQYMSKQQEDYKRVIERLTARNPKEYEFARREKMRQLELQRTEKSVKSFEELDDAMMKLTHSLKINEKESEEVRQNATDVSDALEQLAKDSLTLSQTQREILVQARMSFEQGNIKGAIQSVGTILDDVGKQEVLNFKTTKQTIEANAKFDRALNVSTRNLVQMALNEASFTKALGYATATATAEFSKLQFAIEHQVPIMNIFGHGLWNVAEAHRMSVEALMKVQAQYAHALNASAGRIDNLSQVSLQFEKAFDQNQQSLMTMSGTYNDAGKLMASIFNVQTFMGVHQSIDQMSKDLSRPKGLLYNLRIMSEATGQTAQELIDMNEGLMKDYDFRTSMLTLSKRERAARFQELIAIERGLVAKGKDAQEAAAVAVSLQKMRVQISPQERFKDIYKAAILGQAFGVKGAMKLPHLLENPVQNWQQIQKIATAYQSRSAQLMGQRGYGNIGYQMYGYMLQNAFGSLSPYMHGISTAGQQGRAFSSGTQGAIEKMAETQKDQLTGIQGILRDIEKDLQYLGHWMEGPLGGTLMSAAHFGGSIAKEGITYYLFKKLLSKGIRGGAGADAAGAAETTEGVGAAVEGGAALASLLPILAAVGTGVGLGYLNTKIAPKYNPLTLFGDWIGGKVFDATHPEFNAPMKPTPLKPGASPATSTTSTGSPLQQNTDALNQLTSAIVTNTAAQKDNTQSTQTNSQVTHKATTRKALHSADPGSGG